MRKNALVTLLIISMLVLVKFWVGIYEHDEFSKEHVFFKHRAIWKTHFYSPRGMSDLKLSEMSDQEKIEQKLFDEFILENQFSK